MAEISKAQAPKVKSFRGIPVTELSDQKKYKRGDRVLVISNNPSETVPTGTFLQLVDIKGTLVPEIQYDGLPEGKTSVSFGIVIPEYIGSTDMKKVFLEHTSFDLWNMFCRDTSESIGVNWMISYSVTFPHGDGVYPFTARLRYWSRIDWINITEIIRKLSAEHSVRQETVTISNILALPIVHQE